MKIYMLLITIFISVFLSPITAQPEGKHLFILSGQSNMARLVPEDSFTPTVQSVLGAENVLVVKQASGGKPIRRWYREWKPLSGEVPTAQADLYDTLMTRVLATIKAEKIATITFIWMQGERDAREKHGAVYEASLIGLYDQLCNGLARKDINFVIGRLSDFDLSNEKYPHWTMIRDIQVRVADSNPRFAWINTDDLNDGLNSNGKEINNDLHMSKEGYILMGQRFADQAIRLIKEKN